MAQEQRQHLDRFSRVGKSPDDTPALTWNACIGNHVVLLGSPVYCTWHKNNNSISIGSSVLAGHRTTRQARPLTWNTCTGNHVVLLTALPQTPMLDLRRPTSKGKEGSGRGKGGKGKGLRGGEERGNGTGRKEVREEVEGRGST